MSAPASQGLPELLTAKEVAAYLKLHEVTVVSFARKGKLPGFKVGREWRFRAEDVQAWMEAREKHRQWVERFNALADRLGEAIRAAGYGPDDVERLIKEVRAEERASSRA